MRIAIITYAFYESTLPLFKHLSELCDVDLYCLFSNRFLNPPSFDISDAVIKLENEKNKKLSNSIIPEAIKNYLGETVKNVNIYTYKLSFINLFFRDNYLGNFINTEKYDCIHFINLSSNYLPIVKRNYKSTKIICSLHESDFNRTKKNKISLINTLKSIQQKRAKSCIKYLNYITFFSNNEREKFLEEYAAFKKKSSVIKFGLFETFKYFSTITNENTAEQDDYYLYTGYIRAYKGVDFLLKVICETNQLHRFKFVIAGKDDMGISKTCKCSNVTFINRFLLDSELTNLVKNAKALILPYQNASQSGLPNVAFCFNKPVLYSNVKGLNEYLSNNYNGISFEVNNAEELKNAIIKIEENEIYKNLQTNIEKSPFKEDLSWNNIARKFYNTYKLI